MAIVVDLANTVWKLIKEFQPGRELAGKLVSLGFVPAKDAQPVAVWYGYLKTREDISDLLYVFYHIKRLFLHGVVPIPPDYFSRFFAKRGFEFLTQSYNLFCLVYNPSFTGLRVLKYLQQCIALLLQKYGLSLIR